MACGEPPEPQMGWECPRCHVVNGPNILKCQCGAGVWFGSGNWVFSGLKDAEKIKEESIAATRPGFKHVTTFPGPHYALPYLRGSELFKICYQIVNPAGKNGPLAAADKASDLFKRLHLVITGFPVPSEQD